jgi:long-chain fatty acid transport protein
MTIGVARLRILGISIGISICLAPSHPWAGGFFVPQQTITGIGRAFAGDAAGIDDPSTIFSNPAGMTRLGDAQVSVGVSLIKPTISFKDNGSSAAMPGTLGLPVIYGGNNGGDPGSWTPVPNLYAAMPTSNKDLWFGIGVTAPFGLGIEYDPGWFGRYDSIETQLLTIDAAPSVAYKINNFISVGAGLDLQYANATLSNALPDPLNPGGPTPATDGLVTLKENGFAVGYNLGVLFQPTATTRVGLSYRSGITQNLSGDATIQGLSGPLAGQNGVFGVSTKLNLPAIASLAVSQKVTSKLTLLGEVQWFDWSTFQELRFQFDDGRPDVVLPQNYRDSYTVAVGAEYKVTDDVTMRTGFQFDQTPTVDSDRNTNLPDGNRYWITLGADWRISDRSSLDAAYAHVFFENGDVNVTRTFYDGTPLASTVNVNGQAQTSVDTVSLNFRYKF